MENDTGSWWLFTVSAGQPSSHWLTLVHSSYADNLKLIENNSHKDSLKTPLKLDTGLDIFEINQMVNSRAFDTICSWKSF